MTVPVLKGESPHAGTSGSGNYILVVNSPAQVSGHRNAQSISSVSCPAARLHLAWR